MSLITPLKYLEIHLYDDPFWYVNKGSEADIHYIPYLLEHEYIDINYDDGYVGAYRVMLTEYGKEYAEMLKKL